MIETLKEIVIESPGFYVGWGGLLIGLVFGYIAYRTNFCTMGSISDILNFGDYGRFRSWLLAAAIAMVGVALLERGGVMDPADSMYLTPNFGWLANIVGGLIFGFGMVFTGGCVSRNLVRAGSGDLRSVFVLLVTGAFAYITIGGILGPLRVTIFGPGTADLTEAGMETQGLDELVSTVSGMGLETANLAVLVLIVGGILIYCFKDAEFRSSAKNMAAGVFIGLCVVAGWFLTGLAQDEFADVAVPLISLSYVRPAGDTMEFMMRYTALGAPNFGVVTTVGAILGGFVAAASTGRLHLATFADPGDTLRNIGGAALMGIGGVLALGCTLGQGMTGVSTLAIGSFLTFIFIVVGGIIGMKTMENML